MTEREREREIDGERKKREKRRNSDRKKRKKERSLSALFIDMI